MKTKICCVFNLAPHYRAPIFRLMDEQLNCDFYFGDRVDTPIKLMDYKNLVGFKKVLTNRKVPLTGFEYQSGAWKLIFKSYKYYIITGTPGSLSNWFLAIAALLTGKKVYAWTHGIKGDGSAAKKFIERNFYRLCDKILLYGDLSKENMIQAGFKSEKLLPIYNSLDFQLQEKIRESLLPSDIYRKKFQNEDPVLVYIGRIQFSKKLDQLIHCIYELNNENTPCNLMLIGPDLENGAMHELVDKYKLQDKVWFYGPSYDEAEIGELLFNADICVSPGPIGLTALHAATYGIPIITNDNIKTQMPEHELVIEGQTGFFFEEGSKNGLKEAIRKFMLLSEEEKNEMGKNLYSLIKNKYNPYYQIQVLKNLTNQS